MSIVFGISNFLARKKRLFRRGSAHSPPCITSHNDAQQVGVIEFFGIVTAVGTKLLLELLQLVRLFGVEVTGMTR